MALFGPVRVIPPYATLMGENAVVRLNRPGGRLPGWRAVGFAVLVLVVVAELGVAIWRSHELTRPTHVAVSSPGGPPPASTTLTVPLPVLTIPPTVPSTTTSRSSTPPTTLAGVTSPTLVSNAGDVVTYDAASGAPITVTVTSPCWIEVRADATGPVLSDKIYPAGQAPTFKAPAWVRFGNPSGVTVSIAGHPATVDTSLGPSDLSVTSGS